MFTPNDVFRLIEEYNEIHLTNLPENSHASLSLIKKEEIVPELEQFTALYSVEMQSKFHLYSSTMSATDGSIRLGICDFMTLLKVIFQDRNQTTLTLGSDISKTSVFQSLSASKQVAKSLDDFFFEVIKIDPSLEMNHKHKLKMNYEIFVAIFNHLLRKKVLEWTVTNQGMSEETTPKLEQDSEGLHLIVSLNLHNHIKKVIDSESPLSFKLMEAITDIKSLYDGEMRPAEKQVAKEVLKNLTQHLSRLKFYINNFDSYKDHLKILEKERRKMEQIYFLHTSNSFYAHYNMKNQNIDLDKYLGLLDTLDITKLLQGYTKKNFVVLYMLEATRTGHVDFNGFVLILENLICKLLERYPEHSFESMLEMILRNNDKKKLTVEKRSSFVLAKEKTPMVPDKNSYFIKKTRNASKVRKDSERDESNIINA